MLIEEIVQINAHIIRNNFIRTLVSYEFRALSARIEFRKKK